MCQLVHWVLWVERSLACLCRASILSACPVRAHGVPCVREGTRAACHLRALEGYGCAWLCPWLAKPHATMGVSSGANTPQPPVAREGDVGSGRATHFLIHCTRVSPFLFPIKPMAAWLLLSMSKCILLTNFYHLLCH